MERTAEDLDRERQNLRSLLDAQWEWTLRNAPEYASYLGDKRWNDQVTDYSGEAIDRRHAETLEWLEKFRAINPSGLSVQEELSVRLMVDELEEEIEDHELGWFLMPLNQMTGLHLDIPEMVTFYSYETVKDYEDLITRYHSVPAQIGQVIELLRRGIENGLLPPRFINEIVAGQIENLVKPAPSESAFAYPLGKFPDTIGEDDRQRIRVRLLAAISDAVVPAYVSLGSWVRENYVPAGRVDDGIWSLPDGARRYANRILRETTLPLSADEVHEIGLREVARIENEMLEIARSQGHGTIEEYNRALDRDPAVRAGTRERIVELYRKHTDQMYERIPTLFGRLPKASLEIRPVEQWREENEASASYYSPAPDGSRPGRVMVNTFDAENRKTITMESTAYHEGVPGHHMQLAIQQELTELPDFRQEGGHNAYVEGWALYSEALGKEVGFFEEPASDYGRLQDEMLRAIRLVVDTGVHAKKWTRQDIVDYFKAHSALDEFEIRTEADRYIAWPGQALGYKIGQLKIVELRERARERQGEQFDIREFHDTVLGSGSLPLTVLEEVVERWMEEVEGERAG